MQIEAFRDEVVRWLKATAVPRADTAGDAPLVWGAGSDSVAVFENTTEEEERRQAERISDWQRTKFDAGYGAIAWPTELGGRGLTPAHEAAFRAEEAKFETPGFNELFGVTIGLVAPTIGIFGTPEQQQRFIPSLLRTDLLACQLFSEPGAGSDLASLSCRAERDGDGWRITGQKVWTSGARVAHYGEAICRTDPAAPKHHGMTAFLVPLDAPGVEVRPIRQMTGGSTFNEVFLEDVLVPDDLRLGAPGDGWKVALTTLGFERGLSSAGGGGLGGSFRRLHALARHLDRATEPVARQQLAQLYIGERLLSMLGQRARGAMEAGRPPGPEASVGKLLWTQNMSRTSELASTLLGPRLAADTGEWGTFAWTEHVLGAPGYRIAGGSDEIQRNIIGERVLGLPREPRPPIP
jgi:alkylation response protein AidB-like acyl-CoA dehydrogenase